MLIYKNGFMCMKAFTFARIRAMQKETSQLDGDTSNVC